MPPINSKPVFHRQARDDQQTRHFAQWSQPIQWRQPKIATSPKACQVADRDDVLLIIAPHLFGATNVMHTKKLQLSRILRYNRHVPYRIFWTDYLRYRAALRGFDLEKIEEILRHTLERYVDTSTGRYVAIGRHDHQLVIIPYEADSRTMTPITIHATTREQINLRLRSGRFKHE